MHNEHISRQPYLLCIIAMAGGYLVSHYFSVELPPVPGGSDWGSLGGSIASIAATLLGFMLAALAVMASINNTHLISMMRKTGHYRDLLHTLFIGSAMLLACAIFGFVVMFGLSPTITFFHLLIAVHIAALAMVIDVGRKFWLVLSNLRDQESD